MTRIADFLRANGTRTHAALEGALSGTAMEYLSKLLPPNGFGRGVGSTAKLHLVETLRRHLADRLPVEQIDHAVTEFWNNPILQVGDHSDLLLEHETFFNSYFYQIAARERRLHYLFTQQCSRTRLCQDSKALVGPGYLHTNDDVLNVYGASKSVLKRFSAATLTDVTLRFTSLGVLQAVYSHPRLPEVIEPLAGLRFERATVAVERANAYIWNALSMKAKMSRISFDEGLTCDVTRAHVADSSSVVHALLFSDREREDFLRRRNACISAKGCRAVRATTDFFWYVRQGSVRPVRIRAEKADRHFVDALDQSSTGVVLTPDCVAAALEERALLPDRILSDAVLSILPGVVLLGGPTHHEGHAIVEAIFESFSPGCAQLRTATCDLGSRMIGGLVEVTPPIAKLIGNLSARTELDAFEDDVLRRPLRKTLGKMRYFEYVKGLFDPARP